MKQTVRNMTGVVQRTAVEPNASKHVGRGLTTHNNYIGCINPYPTNVENRVSS